MSQRDEPVTGTCALCQVPDVPLRQSHLIPQWVYRVVRGSQRDIVSVVHSVARYSDRQAWVYLLCSTCEQRIGRSENYVKSISYQEDGTCPVVALVGYTPGESLQHQVAWRAASELDRDAIARFAVSIIWRASAAGRGFGPVHLGPYKEKCRLYLLEQIGFPTEFALVVTVHDPAAGGDYHGVASSPTSARDGGTWYHSFICAGFVYKLFVSRTIERVFSAACLMRGSPSLLFFGPIQTDGISSTLGSVLRDSDARGRLKRERGERDRRRTDR